MKPSLFTRAWSLIEDSDIIPARTLLEVGYATDSTDGKMANALYDDLQAHYPFLWAPDVGRALAEHYENYYANCEGPKTGLKFHDIRGSQRFHAIASALRPLPAGWTVLDWGCAEGSMILNLARELPHLKFFGADISQQEIDALYRNWHELNGPIAIPNFLGGATVGHNERDAFAGRKFHVALACEVLEHVPEPWVTLDVVESYVGLNGWVVITTPQGPWELLGCREQGAKQWPWRAHIWHLTPEAYADPDDGMLRDKPGMGVVVMNGIGNKYTIRGHVLVGYRADHKPAHPIDPLWKAGRVNLRPTLAIDVPHHASYHGLLDVIDGMAVPPVAVTGMMPDFYDARPWIRDWYAHREVSIELKLDA